MSDLDDRIHPEAQPDDQLVCEFCQGIRAHEAGLPREANPYPPSNVARDRESPHNLWDSGWRSEDLWRNRLNTNPVELRGRPDG